MGYRKYTERELLGKVSYYKSLTEKRRRHFLAVEHNSLGRGSQRYISSVFGCCHKTLRKGCRELLASPAGETDYTRQRAPGGGRKKRVCNN